jgi:hypothetical protein
MRQNMKINSSLITFSILHISDILLEDVEYGVDF